MTTASADAGGVPIPDFCRLRRVLALVLSVELLAVVFALLVPGSLALMLTRFVIVSVYLQAICLLSAMGLCILRRRAASWRPLVTALAAGAIIMLVSAGVSAAGYRLSRILLDPAVLPDESLGAFVLRNTLAAALVAAMLLRYFWTRARWEDQARVETEARFQSLSARIRPHFLFNSLNSIAALIAIKPSAAETMVEDLADLFRATLAKGSPLVTMAEEIDLVRKFARIEQTRLGSRLGVDWDLPESVMHLSIPRLTIQPLVENAVHHGAARATGPVTIVIRARREGELLVVEVENPLPPQDDPGHTGSQTAVSNIGQRVRLLYGDQASLQLERKEGVFCARLQLPARPLAGDQHE